MRERVRRGYEGGDKSRSQCLEVHLLQMVTVCRQAPPLDGLSIRQQSCESVGSGFRVGGVEYGGHRIRQVR